MKKLLVGAAAAAMLMATAAQAVPALGTGSLGAQGVTGVPGSGPFETIGLNSTFSFLSVAWAGGTGDFSGIVLNTSVTSNPITAAVGSLVSFSIDGGYGSFDGTVTAASQSGPQSNRVVDLFALGTFTPGPALGVFDAGPMSMTWSATQTGVPTTANPTRAISVSWTIASPPTVIDVPEPMSLALLGFGLLGAGLASRRKAASA